ncbi:MAG: 2-polyprenylphenol 6-hydroxylase [Rhodospirillales bacterium]
MGGLGNGLRLLRVARILARHDALFLLDKLDVAPVVRRIARLVSRRNVDGRPGERLARALQAAGPSFIKLGQALSTRSDLLGEELCEDLSALQDALPPFSGAEARRAIEAEFEQPIDALFEAFDDAPVAAASIAQVHFAITRDGREVAVKVLRPGIETRFQDDLNLFRWVAGLVEARAPAYRRFRPVAAIETLAETVAMEMDLRFEAAAAAELGDNFAGDPDFRVPTVDWSLTGHRVLTTERIDGLAIDDRDALVEAGHDPTRILKIAANSFFRQAFRDGFFHADLHPGNMFVTPDGAVAVVDFGIMGRLDFQTRRTLGEMLLGFLTRDYRRVAEVHFEAGWVPAHKSVDAFTQACRAIAEPILDKPQNEISIGRLLGLLFHVAQTFEMEVQPQLLLLQKTMLVAEGTARQIEPDANMWLMARPLIEDWMRAELGPEARIRRVATSLSDIAQRLPRILDEVERAAATLADGRISLDDATLDALKRGRGGGFMRWLSFALALAAGALLASLQF